MKAIGFASIVCAAIAPALVFAAPAQAAVTPVAFGYSDPSVDGPFFALHKPGGFGELRAPTGTQVLTGNHPSIGGGRAAWIEGQNVLVSGVGPLLAPGADAVAVSNSWVVWRAGKTLHAASLDPATGFAEREVVTGEVGRPALSFNTLVFDLEGRIESLDLVTGASAHGQGHEG